MNDDCDFNPPPIKKRKGVSSKSKASASVDRFASVSDEKLAELSKGFVPDNTRKNTNWAMNVFLEWKAATNSRLAKEKKSTCPDDLLDKPDLQQLNTWLSKFVVEARTKTDQPYPSSTLQQILSGLQRHYLDKSPTFPKIMDKKEPIHKKWQTFVLT